MTWTQRIGTAFVVGVAATSSTVAPAWAQAQGATFPRDRGVVDVTQPPYSAKPDGATDCTTAIQKALSENVESIIYLPNGTYIISDTLKWAGRQSNTTLWGQSTDGAVLKLRDASPGYTSARQPKAMVWTGNKPAQRFKNYIRNLTFDVGRNNPGAIGAQFISNNTGSFREVTIRSGDGQGAIGLDLGYTDEQGPCLIKNVKVIGFDVGVSCRTAVDSITFEAIALEGQRSVGLRNDGQCVSIRGLTTRNVPLAVHNSGTSLMCLIDAELAGSGPAAIVNQRGAGLYARNVKVAGFQQAIQNSSGSQQSAAGPEVGEFTSHPVASLFPSPPRALHLPIRETPDVPWEDPAKWVNAVGGAGAGGSGAGKGGGPNVAAAVQRAIDSGAKTLYFPVGTYAIGSDVVIRGNVERIIGLGQGAAIRGGGHFVLDDGAPPVVVIEAIQGLGKGFVHQSKRTVVLRNMTVQALGGLNTTDGYIGTDAAGDAFLEDVCSSVLKFGRGQKIWARQLNTERQGTHILNDGAVFWVLGLKTERGGTLVHTRNGGKTEVCGGFAYDTTYVEGAPMFLSEDCPMSVTFRDTNFASQRHGPFDPSVREVRGGQTKDLRPADLPRVTGGAMIVLFSGHAQ